MYVLMTASSHLEKMGNFSCRRDGVKMFGQAQWHSPLIPARGRQRSVDPCEFKSTLIYIISSRQSGIYRKTLSQRAKRKEKSWSEPQSNEWKELGADPNKTELHILSLPLKNFFSCLF